MKEQIWKALWRYSERQIQHIPDEIYAVVAFVLIIGITASLGWKGLKTGLRYSAGLLLMGDVFLIFCSTVFLRKVGKIHKYDFHPFWSYSRPDLLVENIMNVVVFIPIGMILGLLLRFKGSWLLAALIGCSISVAIETLQFYFKRGFSEVDDVMHNTLGCMIGFGIVTIVRIVFETRYNKHNNFFQNPPSPFV